MIPSPVAYDLSLGVAAVVCAGICAAARRRPGPWVLIATRAIGLLLLADAVSRLLAPAWGGAWSVRDDLPLFLCDITAWIAAAGLWWRSPILLELTYFWGLAGGIQGVFTPTVSDSFPRLGFLQYVVLHDGVVVAALVTVIALEFVPRRRAVARIFLITCGYTALVGIVDAASGADYMYLRRPPRQSTLLQLLGPWPWYLCSAAIIALALLIMLDAPFWRGRPRQERGADAGHHLEHQ